LSIFTAADCATAALPARSVTVTAPATFAPSLERTSGLVADDVATPDKLSATVNGIETLPWYQPAAFGELLAPLNVTVGAVLSMRMVIDCVDVSPALFVAEQVEVVPDVSAVSIVVAQPLCDTIGDSPSVTDRLTVTSPLCQPAALAGVLIGAVISGGVTSATVAPVIEAQLQPFDGIDAKRLNERVQLVPIYSNVDLIPLNEALQSPES
jgi:hypothetical protein